jgi:hypothetical protein
VVKGFSSWNTKVASTLPNGKYLEIKDATHFSLATAEVHLSSIQYLLKQLIQASLSLSIRYYFFKAKTTLSNYPYQF